MKSATDGRSWQTFEALIDAPVKDNPATLSSALGKARFWERFAKEPLNERQIKVLNRLLDSFEGKLTTSKWAKIAKYSQDTAYRDILDLPENTGC